MMKWLDKQDESITIYNNWTNLVANGEKTPVLKDGKIVFVDSLVPDCIFNDDDLLAGKMDDDEEILEKMIKCKSDVEKFVKRELAFLRKALNILTKDDTNGESLYVMCSRLLRAICAYSDADHKCKKRNRTFIDAVCMLRHNCGNDLWDGVFKFHSSSSQLISSFRSIWPSAALSLNYVNVLSSEDPYLSFEAQEKEMKKKAIKPNELSKPLVMKARRLLTPFIEFDDFGNPLHVFPEKD